MEHKECKCCCSGALIVAGIIFAIVSLVHLYRFFYFFPVVIGTYAVPAGVSIVAFIIFALLAIWMFMAVCKKCRCDRCKKDELNKQ